MVDVVKFTRNRDLLGGDAAIGLVASAPKDLEVARALAENSAFPDRAIEVGKVSLTGEGGKDVTFGKGRGKVAFTAEGGAHGVFGVYRNGKQVMRKLKLGTSFARDIELPVDKEKRFFVLRSGYDLGASAGGSIALGAGITPTLNAQGETSRRFAVVRMLKRDKGARDAVREVANSWILPKQVNDAGDLRPGTWIIAEVDGSVALTLGGRYGIDFNWVREAELGGLTGDIGLRLQLGVAVALGFNAGGSYALMVSRETKATTLRVRLLKLSNRGWDFALSANASAKPKTKKLLKADFESFVSAVFGLSGAQLVDDVATIRKWTSPDRELPELLAGAGTSYALELVGKITGIDPEKEFSRARGRVVNLLDRWETLPHEVSSMLWEFVPDSAMLSEVRRIAGHILEIDADDEEARKALLREILERVNFADLPAGKWLEAAVVAKGDDLLKLVVSAPAFRRLQGVAAQTIALLDGDTFQESLVELHAWISDRVQLDRVQKVVDEASFGELDAWVKGRLAGFLGKEMSRLGLEDIESIRRTITLILDKKDAFHQKAVDALNRKYRFAFSATYQKATERSALLDVEFDFSKGDLGPLLRAAVNGDFGRIMSRSEPGVRLNVAALSHGVTRQSHVSVDMPFLTSDLSHINTALVKVKIEDDEGGRLLIYDPEFEDEVAVRNKRNSRLTIAGSLKAGLNSVRVRTTGGLDFSYAYRQATPQMRRQALAYQIKPYVDAYFQDLFPPGERSLESWIGDLDRRIDEIEPNGPDRFGDTLLSVEVSLSQKVAAAWLNAPGKKSDPRYAEMSRRLQRELKRTLSSYYFQNPKKFKNLKPAASLLVYSLLPPSTAVSLSRRGRTRGALTLNRTRGDIYWDWKDPDVLRAMLHHPSTQVSLVAELQKIHWRLQGELGMAGIVAYYEPTAANLNRVIGDALGDGRPFLDSLLFVESQVVRAARKAGLDMARFQQHKITRPAKAAEALAGFGAEITAAFNSKLKSHFDRGALRPLGTQLFVAAAQSLKPGMKRFQQAAMLELTVIRKGAEFPPEGFPNHRPPSEDDTVIAQRFVSV